VPVLFGMLSLWRRRGRDPEARPVQVRYEPVVDPAPLPRTIIVRSEDREMPEPVFRLAEGLGVLDRGVIAAEVKELDQEARSALRGNIALRDEGGGLRTLDVANRQTWGSLPLWDRAQTEVRAQWWWLVAVLVVGAALAVHLARGLRQRAVA
jgi:hypothetical protein